jgi:hypothetical protein
MLLRWPRYQKPAPASIENGSTACPMLPDGRRSHGVHLMSQPSPADSFLSGDTPPSNSARALQALWWAARGSWDRAHSLVQHDGTEDAAWVHAHLHRVEGDLENASYWYRKAGRPSSGDALEAERTSIAAELLQRSTGSAETTAKRLPGVTPPPECCLRKRASGGWLWT